MKQNNRGSGSEQADGYGVNNKLVISCLFSSHVTLVVDVEDKETTIAHLILLKSEEKELLQRSIMVE